MSERQKKRLAQKEANRLKRRMIEKVLSNSKTSNVAFNLNLLVDGWLELESDPGTFSLLIEDFGCFGAQVDEIYDLEQKFDGPVLGFIFLFKWLNNSSNDRMRNDRQKSNSSLINNHNNSSTNDKEQKQEQSTSEDGHWTYVEDENIISEIFFAKQMISNSCATHALISILLNCDYDELNLGPTLTRLKEHTKVMNPENKGYAIGNLPELAKAHNSHASYSSLYNRNKLSSNSASGMSYMISGNQRTNLQQQNKHEAYHFVSYVPINNRLYELDGLKNYPIDHGPFGSQQEWTEKFRKVIKQRLSANNRTGDDPTVSNDIRYNLMAVVPDRRVCLRAELKKLKCNYSIVQDSIKRLTKRVFTPLPVDTDIPNPPYSPLSNGTITASESGSAYNSPIQADEDFLSDYDNDADDDDDNIDDEVVDNGNDSSKKADKYFFVRFNQQINPTTIREENSEPAHKNCIIKVESTNVCPINLAKSELGGKLDQLKTNQKLNNNLSTTDVASGEEKETSEKNGDLKNCENNNNNSSSSSSSISVHETQTNGLSTDSGDEIEINLVLAHNDEKKYNLSTKPPFDFNILDDMQHVHFGKAALKDLKVLSQELQNSIEKIESQLKEEIDKRRKYKIDNSRRTHNYEPFIMTFLSMLATQGNLADLIEKDLGIVSEESTTAATNSDNSTCKTTQKLSANTTSNKVSSSNGASNVKKDPATPKPKPKYRYVSTGRPVGRPRKNPLPVSTSPSKAPDATSSTTATTTTTTTTSK